MLTLLADAAPKKPWKCTDELWDEHLPQQRTTAAQWRRANFALHAAGCLAGGIWRDVGRTESYWRGPFWADVLPVIELLGAVAWTHPLLAPAQFAEQLRALLALSSPAVPHA